MPKAKTEINKVGSKTDPGKLAGAIAGETRKNKDSLKMRINAIGAGAVNQAVKALAIAQGYLMGAGLELQTSFAFIDLVIDGREVTGVQFLIRAIPANELV